ncbi:carboxypeptidase M32 [Anaerobacillus isosaccharinicus]|uniref:Metal-dependent carboxypeptidase n=1 Tax=Anaerobacillus isosaccharinicus TaxID=1532552 RepID=A0A7S7RAH8_9BACI|nr:carboxypeptidase M32 [Anaerobacillus isosaccharinicus]MBA5586912.1 carboxypeptidase M32 [Anaerobacillus isosaccharinicus]QOY34880.1 carboxypeptidase M32 [Anaerobacillus isosaccharinicus]
MDTNIKEIEQSFINLVKKMSSYGEAISLMFWDLRTGAPKKGVEQRSETIGTLSSEVFNMSVSEEMGEYLQALSAPEVQGELSEITRKMVEVSKKEFDKNKKIPADEYKEFVILTSKAESAWEEAKEKADFANFAPYLEKIVAYLRKYVERIGYEKHPYNALLDDYEPGVTVDVLDRVFGELREKLVPLVKAVTEAPAQPKTDFLFTHFSKEKQKDFSLDILKQLQYDFEAGRLDTTVHPFAATINRNDVRITTKYDEKDFRTAIFGTIHECGHALYEQNISVELIGTPLCDGTSMGIHESQSLFCENFVGRTYSFWKKNYSLLKEYSAGQFDNVSLDEFYKAINVAGPSLIRIEADEMTYSLHIILRYEIEKALINGDIEVKDLPQIWNDKMEEYLGVRPTHDGEGVLQDVHWSGGALGYFPSYALGYIYASQLKNKMNEDIPNYDELLEAGNFTPIKEWLTENVHQYGKMKKPLEIIQDITGEGLNPRYLVEYLEKKYKAVYEL